MGTTLLEQDEVDEAAFRVESFVVKIWIEDVPAPGPAPWRGHVTHVGSGTRRPVSDLDGVVAFVALYVGDPATGQGDGFLMLITCEKGPRFRPEKGPRRAWSAV